MVHKFAGFEMSHSLRIRDATFFVPVAAMPCVQRDDAEPGENSGYSTSWIIRELFCVFFFFSLSTARCF